MPWLDHKVRMEDRVHLQYDVGRDSDDGAQVEDPSEKVAETSEEAYASAPSWTCRYRCPMIHTSCSGDGRSELLYVRMMVCTTALFETYFCDRRSQNTVIYAGGYKLI